MAYTAGFTLATMNEPVMVPPEIAQDGDEMGPVVPFIVQVESAEANPEPDTETVTPAGADEGLSVIVGLAMAKVAVAKSLPGLPIAITE
jgi:hypothetical protein